MWFFVALLAVLAAVCLVVARRPRSSTARRARGNSFAAQFKMQVAPADVERFDNVLDRRFKARWLSASASLGAIMLAVALVAGVRDHAGRLFGPTLYVGIIFTAWIGGLFGELAPRVRALPGTRAARLRTPGVGDFLHPALRGYLALLAVGGLLLALFPGSRPAPLADVSTTSALFPAVVLLGCEVFARVVVSLPQPAVDTGELYLADSLRADTLWESYRGGALLTGLLLVIEGIGSTESTVGSIMAGALAVAATVVPGVIGSRPRWSHLRFRERLWPELPADAVVSSATGAPVT